MGLSFTLRALSAPKEGSTEAQYEDAWAVSDAGEATGVVTAAPRLTVALSDGASSAVFARDWARRLVAAFSAGDTDAASVTDADLAAVVAAEARTWREEAETRATSWHAQEKLESGSAATLLIATFDGEARRWDAVAIGDVCLFLVRAGRLKFAFPVTKSAGFDDRPSLLSTELRSPFPAVKRFGAPIEPGDCFFLMTDAIAAWFLAGFERKQRPWESLPADPAAFPVWLQAERERGAMKNDDATVVEVRVMDAAAG